MKEFDAAASSCVSATFIGPLCVRAAHVFGRANDARARRPVADGHHQFPTANQPTGARPGSSASRDVSMAAAVRAGLRLWLATQDEASERQ